MYINIVTITDIQTTNHDYNQQTLITAINNIHSTSIRIHIHSYTQEYTKHCNVA